MGYNLSGWIELNYRVGSSMYDDDFDIVMIWLEMKSILLGNIINEDNTINITDVMFEKSEILLDHFETKVRYMWNLTKIWLTNLENNKFKENFTRDTGKKIEYDYPLTIHSQFPVFKNNYDEKRLRSYTRQHLSYINKYEEIIVKYLAEARDNTQKYQIFDFRVIMLLLDLALVRCGGDVADTYLLKEVYLKPRYLRNTNYKNYIIEDTISKEWLVDILNDQTYYGTSYFHIVNETGNFAFNTWLYAYFNDVELIGVPYGLSEADGKVMCPFQFIKHDRFHGENFRIIKNKSGLLSIWKNIHKIEDIEYKELLIFSLWLMIHEAACTGHIGSSSTSCDFKILLGSIFPGMWTGAWNWVVDLIYPKLQKYDPEYATFLLSLDDFEIIYGYNIRKDRKFTEELDNWITDYEIEGTYANLSSKTLFGCYMLIIKYANGG